MSLSDKNTCNTLKSLSVFVKNWSHANWSRRTNISCAPSLGQITQGIAGAAGEARLP